MAKLGVFLVTAAFGLWCGSGAFAGGSSAAINVGDWHGGAFAKDDGAFSYCGAVLNDGSGSNLLLALSKDGVWLMALTHSGFKLRKKQSVSIDFALDDQKPFQLVGTAANSKTAESVLPSAALAQFAKAHQLSATVKSQTVQLALTGNDKVVALITSCVDQTKTAGQPGKGIDAAATPPAGAAPAGAPKLVHVSGTGFVVSARGHIVTNNHVIADCVGDIQGNLVGEGPLKLRVVSTDATNDLALLEAGGRFRATAVIRRTTVHSGDAVVAIGYPFHGLLSSDFIVTSGIVSSLSGLLNDTRFLQISAPVQPGNSGGPLLDSSGNVVGVVAEKLDALKMARATGDIPENVNFAIKTGALQDFLDNSAVAYQTADPAAELKTPDIAIKARAYTLLIACTAKLNTAERK